MKANLAFLYSKIALSIYYVILFVSLTVAGTITLADLAFSLAIGIVILGIVHCINNLRTTAADEDPAHAETE